MSIVNLHKKFVCKIVETGYFAEIPARASVKGRPKKCPPLVDRVGVGGLAELTAGGAGSVITHQRRGRGIAVNRTIDNTADLVG